MLRAISLDSARMNISGHMNRLFTSAAVLLLACSTNSFAEDDFLKSLEKKGAEISSGQPSTANDRVPGSQPIAASHCFVGPLGFLWLLKGIPDTGSYSTFGLTVADGANIQVKDSTDKFVCLRNPVQFQTLPISQFGGDFGGDEAILDRCMKWQADHIRSQGTDVTISEVSLDRNARLPTLSFAIRVSAPSGLFLFRNLSFRSGRFVVVLVEEIKNPASEMETLRTMRKLAATCQTIPRPLTQREVDHYLPPKKSPSGPKELPQFASKMPTTAEQITWWKEGAERGEAEAQFNLGLMYFKGNGVAKNEAEAIKWFKKAAEQGDVGAQFNVGLMSVNGIGTARDPFEAAKWFKEAAMKGDAQSEFNLGLLFFKGDGVMKDHAEALKWFRKAADQGKADAQYATALMYLIGNGVNKDVPEAAKWLRKSAKQGNADAARTLKMLHVEN